MGLLKLGIPLDFENSLEHLNYVRAHGVKQFLNVFKKYQSLQDNDLKYGYEIEVGLFVIDRKNKSIKLYLNAHEIKTHLIELENIESQNQLDSSNAIDWSPEYGAWMIEGMSQNPFTDYVDELLNVEKSLISRRMKLSSVLNINVIGPTVTSFPLMGINTID